MVSRRWRGAVVLAAGLVLGASALAQERRDPDGQPHEQGSQPPAPPRDVVPVAPGYRLVADGLTVVQVNVNAAGLNIVGDAANEPSLAIDPTAPNRLVMGWRQFDTIASNFRQAGYAWSDDGGRSWHFEGSLTPGLFRSDPVLETDSDGNFYYYTLPGGNWRCELFRSADGGLTWTGPFLANGGDRAWMAIDKTRGIGDGNIYGIWNPSFTCCPGAGFGRDVSGGMGPWPAAIAYNPTPIWGTAAVGPDGEVYVGGRQGSTFRVARSDTARDPNLTPTFPQNVPVNLGGVPSGTFGGPNPGGAMGQTWVDVNRAEGPRRGHVYLLGLYTPAGDALDVGFSRSTDGGLTWSTPVRVNTDPPGTTRWNWFGSLSVSPDGSRIDVTYASNQESASVQMNRVYYTYSTDEGQTWSAPAALTPAWDSFLGWPNQNKIGDYYDQESDDVGLSMAISTTLNGEQDVFFVRVGDWDCNRNGVGDTQDLLAGVLQDCDEDGVPDSCEIAAGAEPDLNGNGIPDGCECYADCNASGTLTIADFGCFQGRFAAGNLYADCNGSGTLTVADFACFQAEFAAGCP